MSETLDDLASNLGSMIEQVNSLSAPHASGHANAGSDADGGGGETVAQVSAILNAHLTTLQWIDGSTNALAERVSEMEGRVAREAGGQKRLPLTNGGYVESGSSRHRSFVR